MGRSFEDTLNSVKRKHPNISDAEARAMARDSYRPKSPKAKANQLKGLTPGNPKRKRRKAEQSPETPRKRARKGDVEKLSIIQFSELLGVELYPAQRVVLKAIYGLPLEPDEMDVYYEITGRSLSVQHGYGEEAVEAVLVLGGRSGKSLLSSIIALYEAIVKGAQWRKKLRKNERGYAVIVATRQQQAIDIVQANVAGLLQDSPLSGWIESEPTMSRLDLVNGMSIMSLPCNSTAGRGLPIICLIFDEVGHFYVEGAKADTDIYHSLAPRMAQFSGAKTILASTPAAKQGLLWEWFEDGFEVAGRATFHGPTKLMNPEVDPDFLERMLKRNPDMYIREFDAEFAERRAAYFPAELVESAIAFATDQEPAGHTYVLGVDQSGLSGRDRFAVAVAHKEERRVVVDAVRSWASTDADFILAEVSGLCAKYGIVHATIDRYAKGWVQAEFEKRGLTVDVRPLLPQIYQNGKSLMLAGELGIPDHQELKEGMLSTMAFYGRNNSMSIEHPRTGEDGHGDLADAVMSAVWKASSEFVTEAFGLSHIELGISYPGEAMFSPRSFDPTVESYDEWKNGRWDRGARIVDRI